MVINAYPSHTEPQLDSIYYHIASDALEIARSSETRFERAQAIATCIVFSALCLEAYINRMYYRHGESLSLPHEGRKLYDMRLKDKWTSYAKKCASDIGGFDEDSEPYKTFSELIDVRNKRLVHFKADQENTQHGAPKEDHFTESILLDVGRAERYFKCVGDMIQRLCTFPLAKHRTELPHYFSKGARYTDYEIFTASVRLVQPPEK